jgi:hypothetical protein
MISINRNLFFFSKNNNLIGSIQTANMIWSFEANFFSKQKGVKLLKALWFYFLVESLARVFLSSIISTITKKKKEVQQLNSTKEIIKEKSDQWTIVILVFSVLNFNQGSRWLQILKVNNQKTMAADAKTQLYSVGMDPLFN